MNHMKQNHSGRRLVLAALCSRLRLGATSRAEPPPVEDTAFGDMVGTMDKARGVEDTVAAQADRIDQPNAAGTRASPTRPNSATRLQFTTMADLSGLERLWLALLRAPVSVLGAPARVARRPARSAMRSMTRPICYVLERARRRGPRRARKGLRRARTAGSPLQAFKPPLPSRRCCSSNAAPASGAIASIIVSRTPMRAAGRGRARRSHARCRPDSGQVLWGRAPDHEGSWLRMMLSENWERVGRFRRMLSVMVNGRNLFVQFGEPVSLRAVGERGPDESRAVRRSRRARCGSCWLASVRLRSVLTCRIVEPWRRKCCAPRAVRRAMADEMRAKKISRREALEARAGLRRRRSPPTTRTSSSPSWRAR